MDTIPEEFRTGGGDASGAGSPLVSVMMPCFNAAETLPMALASLLAQTHARWEAVIVDDGSTDATWDVLRAVDDPRLRVERFPENRGRGAARQRCLEMARGDFLSMLDSDDWLFPDKLAHQVGILGANPALAAVSGVCAITDARDEVVGMTSAGLRPGDTLTVARFARLGPPPFSFPPAMLRMSAIEGASFNPAFRRSQDSDFLIQAVLGERYAVSDTPVYAYSQAAAASLERTLEGYHYRVRSYLQYRRTQPVSVAVNVAKTLARAAVYRAAGAAGLEQRLIDRRWQPATHAVHESFARARAAVAPIAATLGMRAA
ncbi:MAG: glycosyltransferase family 2 protein [Myxococcales bacterium]|nr:glycosyltransferase family 2 protein [Myxococcales bacterium]